MDVGLYCFIESIDVKHFVATNLLIEKIVFCFYLGRIVDFYLIHRHFFTTSLNVLN